MKTVQEWFNGLGEPYRSEALKNAEIKGRLQIKYPNVSDALFFGFIWKDTLEGAEYWANLFKLLPK